MHIVNDTQPYRISLTNDENECVVDNERDVSKDRDNQLVVRLNRLNEDVYFNVLVVLDFNDNVHVIFDVLVVLDFNDNVHVIFDVLVILVFESCPQKSAMIQSTFGYTSNIVVRLYGLSIDSCLHDRNITVEQPRKLSQGDWYLAANRHCCRKLSQGDWYLATNRHYCCTWSVADNCTDVSHFAILSPYYSFFWGIICLKVMVSNGA